MKIGILGAGFVGRILGEAAIAAGHEVMIANSRSPETLFSLKNILGAEVGTAEDAAKFGELVIAAVPLTACRSLPADALRGKIVIDAINYYPGRDGAIPALDTGAETTSEMLASALPGARVVKAFNSIMMIDFHRDARKSGAPDRRAIPIAGDDEAAKAEVAALMDALGYDAYDAGPLAEGWRFERDRPAYCAALDRDALAKSLAATTRESWQVAA
ncbi:NADPH-dependent F420 reductase [Acuticoccus sp. MNP-M23]|uniref:NADPH-dependent F420 reductase n=1 Tax=Acuticoccus sp. MNP-M23 TaxID=3072793 RepID=UPI0035C06ADB